MIITSKDKHNLKLILFCPQKERTISCLAQLEIIPDLKFISFHGNLRSSCNHYHNVIFPCHPDDVRK